VKFASRGSNTLSVPDSSLPEHDMNQFTDGEGRYRACSKTG